MSVSYPERVSALPQRGQTDEKTTENPGLPTEARGGMVEMGGIETRAPNGNEK